MAAFSTMAQAEARARTLMATGAATVAHSCRLKNGTIAVRILRPMTKAGALGSATRTEAGQNPSGAWDTLTDTAAT
jgi:hypothetical protein